MLKAQIHSTMIKKSLLQCGMDWCIQLIFPCCFLVQTQTSDYSIPSAHFESYDTRIFFFFPFAFEFTSLSPQIFYDDWSSWNAYYFDLWPFCGANRVPDIIIACSLIIFPAARQAARQPKPLFCSLVLAGFRFSRLLQCDTWASHNQTHIKLCATIKVRWSSGWTGIFCCSCLSFWNRAARGTDDM